MKLFEKYLLACTNQRIPMPPVWQDSLGLGLDTTVQTHIDTEDKTERIPAGTKSEIVGYRFQQDDVLERGFVNRQVRKLELDENARYLLSLYLEAIKNHRGTDFTPYFSIGVSSFSFPYYTTRASVIRGKKYSVYGLTTKPVIIRLKSAATNEIYAENVYGLLSLISPRVIDIDTWLKGYAASKASSTGKNIVDILRGLQALDEYLTLEVQAYVEVTIVPGTYEKLHMIQCIEKFEISDEDKEGKSHDELYTHEFVLTSKVIEVDNLSVSRLPALYPSVAYFALAYSDKLIPALLDMQITKNLPTQLYELIPSDLDGDTYEQKIKLHTADEALYDVDEFIGSKFVW